MLRSGGGTRAASEFTISDQRFTAWLRLARRGCCASLWTWASIASRNRGSRDQPAQVGHLRRARTSGSSASGQGLSAAAAAPPRNSSRFQRYRNARFTYSAMPAPALHWCGLELFDYVADREDDLVETGLALHLARRAIGAGHFHFLNDSAGGIWRGCRRGRPGRRLLPPNE